MRKINLLISAAIVLAGFTACNNETKEDGKKESANLTSYVDSIENLPPVYTVANWSALDNGYQERALSAERTISTMEAADKEKMEASKLKYASLKANYEAKLKEAELEPKSTSPVATAPDYRQVLRNRLFGEGKIGTDMKFGFVTADNILGVYKNFVNTVDDNKNTYTREDWDEVKVLYEALDTRKNAVEKDLKGSDNMKIAGLKIKFAAIKATHRGGTKGEENAKAKE